MATKKKAPAKTIPMPPLWQDDFRKQVMRTNFCLTLSQPMIELLSAVADGVQWDRRHYGNLRLPDNWIASEQSLTRRGLVRRKTADEMDLDNVQTSEFWNACKLTPAGEAVVQLLKVTGIFVESDEAIEKKTRRRG